LAKRGSSCIDEELLGLPRFLVGRGITASDVGIGDGLLSEDSSSARSTSGSESGKALTLRL
jgi:hypothetical protein